MDSSDDECRGEIIIKALSRFFSLENTFIFTPPATHNNGPAAAAVNSLSIVSTTVVLLGLLSVGLYECRQVGM